MRLLLVSTSWRQSHSQSSCDTYSMHDVGAWEWEYSYDGIHISACYHNTLLVGMVASVYCTVMETTHYTVSGLMPVLCDPSLVAFPGLVCSSLAIEILCKFCTACKWPMNKGLRTRLPLPSLQWMKNSWSVCPSDLCKIKIKYNIQKMKLLCTITQFNSWQIVQGTFMRRLKPHPLPHPLISVCVMRSWDLLICVRKECYHGNIWTNG